MGKTTEETLEEIKKLNQKRGLEKAKVTRAWTFLQNVDETISLSSIKNRLKTVQDAYSEILCLQIQINELDPNLYHEKDEKLVEMEISTTLSLTKHSN
jgi:hypothetical protein